MAKSQDTTPPGGRRARSRMPKDQQAAARGLIVGTDRMGPRFEPGETIVFEPGRTPKDGDHAVLIFKPKRNGKQDLWIRKVVTQQAKTLTVEQYNPPAIQRISRRRLASISRIMTIADFCAPRAVGSV